MRLWSSMAFSSEATNKIALARIINTLIRAYLNIINITWNELNLTRNCDLPETFTKWDFLNMARFQAISKDDFINIFALIKAFMVNSLNLTWNCDLLKTTSTKCLFINTSKFGISSENDFFKRISHSSPESRSNSRNWVVKYENPDRHTYSHILHNILVLVCSGFASVLQKKLNQGQCSRSDMRKSIKYQETCSM